MPLVSGVSGVKRHVLSATPVVEPMTMPLLYTVTIAPGSPVPITVGEWSLVLPVLLLMRSPKRFSTRAITGALGAVVSTVKRNSSLRGPSVPTSFTTAAGRWHLPVHRGGGGGIGWQSLGAFRSVAGDHRHRAAGHGPCRTER